jgi:hypothetical protein
MALASTGLLRRLTRHVGHGCPTNLGTMPLLKPRGLCLAVHVFPPPPIDWKEKNPSFPFGFLQENHFRTWMSGFLL